MFFTTREYLATVPLVRLVVVRAEVICTCGDSIGQCTNPIDVFVRCVDDGTLYGLIFTRQRKSLGHPSRVSSSVFAAMNTVELHSGHTNKFTTIRAKTWYGRDNVLTTIMASMDMCDNIFIDYGVTESPNLVRRIHVVGYSVGMLGYDVEIARKGEFIVRHSYRTRDEYVYKGVDDRRYAKLAMSDFDHCSPVVIGKLNDRNYWNKNKTHLGISARYDCHKQRLMVPSVPLYDNGDQIEQAVISAMRREHWVNDHDAFAADVFALIAFSYDSEYLRLLSI